MKNRVEKNVYAFSVVVGCFFFLFCLRSLPADEKLDPFPEVSQGAIQFYVDYACFKNFEDEKSVYVEVYLSILGDQLTYIQDASTFCAVAEIGVVLRDVRGSRVQSENWRLGCEVATFEDTRNRRFLFDMISFLVKPEKYTLEVKVKDANSSKEGTGKLNFQAFSFKGDELMLSQIELAAMIEPDTTKHKLVKNGRRITPNPIRSYGINWPMLYFYAEVYNLSLESDQSSTYTTQYSILDEQGEVIKEYPSKPLPKPGISSVIMSGLNVVTLPLGVYTFQVKVVDDATAQEAVSRRNFVVLKPRIPTEDTAEELPKKFTEDEAERQLDLIRYIASRDELNVYKDLLLKGKHQFIEEFWRRRDPTPETPFNEFQQEHVRRFEEANRIFTAGNREGWKTDFGRIFILYGKPDEVERHAHEIDVKPHEKWYYFNIEGGVEFIFADLDGFGTYTLIHSTARNEVNDPNYARWLEHSPR
jgi:GWxTD domain-containing protein